MNDREKIIKGLECCLANDHKKCPYKSTDEGIDKVTPCTTYLMEDALALLKAQELIEARLHLCDSCTKKYPECDVARDGIEFGCGVGNDNIIGCTAYVNQWKAQEPVKPTIGGDADGPCKNWWYQCGKCKEAIDYHDKYCRYCGQAVKWW